MRIVFMGTPEFAVPSLKMLCDAGYDVVGVVTQPDKPRGRGKKVSFSPVKEYAVSVGIPVFQPVKIRRDGVDMLRTLQPDLCVTAAFGQILSQEILDIPRLGTVNVHASLLPKHRGSAPVAWAVMQGDRETGITTMVTSRGIDDGDMLLQRSTAIGETETAGELTSRLSRIGEELLCETLKQIENGTVVRIPQNHEAMTYDPMLKKEMGILDWSRDAREIACMVNGLNPWPCASIPWNQGRMKLLRAKAVEDKAENVPFGTMLTADSKSGLRIACGSGSVVHVLEVQAAGGKPMKAEDYFRGHAAKIGEKVTEEIQ